ncbi:hypothetical protein WR25_23297 [Diploscapter pachys]|uniref:Neurotransmitter-gated ion-channel transmembrane domain-containing protein n=1 Tax=Diploscapter pachys TaxID=2018661 RepID=A0A2A2J7B9_9BILA|nr:hypothetical protein WR25_23297 [Diploscapter pachys]
MRKCNTNVDEKNQVITLVAWIEYQWTDYKLVWEPSEYGGIRDIRYPGSANAVLLYNSADENFDSTYPVNYVVSNTGSVLQVPPGILKLSCKIDITYFPFDEFGSWTYSGNFIDLRINGPEGANVSEQGIDIQYYVQNGEWNLLGFNLIIPSFLISLMTVLGFTLPPDAGEKITLEITILLSVCLFLSMVAEMTPPTSEAVPLIGAFFSCCMLVVSASVVFTVLVLNLHNRRPETHEMSPFLRKCLLIWLPWMLMMRRPGTTLFNKNIIKAELKEKEARKPGKRCDKAALLGADQTHSSFDTNSLLRFIKATEVGNNNIKYSNPNQYSMTTSLCLENGQSRLRSEFPRPPPNIFVKSMCDSDDNTTVFTEMNRSMQKACLELKNIGGQIKVMRKKMEEDERDEQSQNDWKFAAMVVDRMCLFMFTLFILVSTCGIMFTSPHLIA